MNAVLATCIGGALALGLTAAAPAQTGLTTIRVASGLSNPLYVTHAPGDFSRIFIVEQGSGGIARIKIMNLATGTVNATPFLTLTGLATGGEQGLLGLAFHPSYASNGFFYVDYTAPGGSFGMGITFVRRYQVTANPDIADPASGQTVIRIDQPFTNHNGGWIGFGPENHLYVNMGDGGSGNDPGNRAQDITDQLLGKILRLDISTDAFPGDPDKNYGIPPANPFVGVTGDDEIWAYGVRNPWRASFDRATNDMWIGDVGQNAWEEIDFQPAFKAGVNYGWRCMEGKACTGLTGCTCNAPELTLPVHVYAHTNNPCDTVTGGYVYRGCSIPDLNGTYFFADYCRSQIWSFRYDGTNMTEFKERTAELDPPNFSINSISSFGEDAYGEVYIVDAGGEIFKIVPAAFVGPDCNRNNQRDECDILSGSSLDANNNGIPDECEEECYADCEADGDLDIDDFVCFQTMFAVNDEYADCENDGDLDIDDFICFQTLFAVGCP